MAKNEQNKQVKENIEAKLSRYFGVVPAEATRDQMYKAVVMTVKDILTEKRGDFKHEVNEKGAKRVYYMCIEFLLGRSLKTSICNLGLSDEYADVLGEYGYMLCGLNALTAVSNLLPCEGLDGYGILRAVLEGHGLGGGLRVLDAVGVGVNIFIMLSALFLMMRIGEGYWIFGLFLWNTVVSLEKLRKRRTF